MKTSFVTLFLTVALLISCNVETQEVRKPNILIILTDDQGNADAGYQRMPSTVSTPAIDQIAEEGVVFTQGYSSAYVCAPTRAGLLTGRYQQRFGFYRASDSRTGMPLSEITLADLLQKEGYHTGIFGKWHLGLTQEYHPCSRGFDEFYGFLGHGAHDYFDLSMTENPDDFHHHIYRNLAPISDTGYLTDNLAREASLFIEKHANKENPFFVYLPFNAVHFPLQAPDADIKKFDSGDPKRDTYLAMLLRMDEGIGRVVQTLKDEGVYDNTLIFYFSDNGGAKNNRSENLPLRDYKHSVYEGGLRVPFVMSWPDRLTPSTSDEPVISIDILPTICATLDIPLPESRIYDGRNILSAIQTNTGSPLHERLFFDGNDNTWAVREGKWKLVYSKKDKLELYNLEDDAVEQNNLVEEYPEIAADLKEKYTSWRNEMGTPMGKKKN
jgi:arylsulfatase A-like enzyme